MQQKILTADGKKDWQRDDPTVNREFPYRNWLRTWGAFCVDVDSIMFTSDGNDIRPYALVDITMGDLFFEDIKEGYLNAIIGRYFGRDSQGKIQKKICELLHIRGYLLLFTNDMLGFWVYSFTDEKWKKFTKDAWRLNLERIKSLT